MKKPAAVLMVAFILVTSGILPASASTAEKPVWPPQDDPVYDYFTPNIAAALRQAAKNGGYIGIPAPGRDRYAPINDGTYYFDPPTLQEAKTVAALREKVDVNKFPYHLRHGFHGFGKLTAHLPHLTDSDLLDLQILAAIRERPNYVGKEDPGYTGPNGLKAYVVWNPVMGGW